MEDLELVDYEALYRALVFAIRSNWGYGFHNHDQGHAVYAAGRDGEEGGTMAYADTPDRNSLFRSLKILSARYGDGNFNTPQIETWRDFCRLAYGGYMADMIWQKRGQRAKAEFDEEDFK